MLELPKPPWYRRVWVFNLTVLVVVAAVLVGATVLLRSRGEGSPSPTTVAAVRSPVAEAAGSGLARPDTTRAAAPGVLWQKTGRDMHHGSTFEARPGWRLVWSFDCRNFARYGGGNFKIAGEGAFASVSVQDFAVRGHGSRQVRVGGRGRLTVESVCDRWTVRALLR